MDSETGDRIAALRHNLISTDYQAIKYSEGEMTEEEYAPIKEQRRQWRREINELEDPMNDGE